MADLFEEDKQFELEEEDICDKKKKPDFFLKEENAYWL